MSKNEINWVQKITLPDGTETPGVWKPNFDEWGLSDLKFKNKRVLDIGCLDGAYSFFAEQAGAKEVVSIDLIEPKKNKDSYPQGAYTNDGYLYAHKAFKSKAKYVFPFSIYDINKEQFGSFDIVLFLGVLYHLAQPILALEKINKVLKKDGIVVIESEVSRTLTQFYHKNHLKQNLRISQKQSVTSKIKSKFIHIAKDLFKNQNAIFNNDTSVFWVPTTEDLERYIDFSGFAIEKKIDDGVLSRATYICRKVQEPNPIYAAESMYTNYKNRFSNLKNSNQLS